MQAQRYLLLFSLLCSMAGNAIAQIALVGANSASAASGTTTTIQYIASGNVSTTNNGNVTPTLPGSGTTGDLYICLVESHDSAAHGTPSGWTNYYDRYDTLGTHHSSMWYRFNTGSTPSNPTFTHSGSSTIGRCDMFRGVDTSNPFDVVFVGEESTDTSSLAATTPALTPITPGAMMLFNVHVNNNPGSLSWPASWTQAFYSSTSSGNDSGLGMAYYLNTTGATIGPLTATWSSQSGISTGALVALRPASTAGTSLTVSVPAGTSASNVMVASVAITPSSASVVAPSGWTLVRSTTQSSGSTGKLYTYWRSATSSEPASYTWTLSGSHTGAVGGIVTFSGADNATPVDVESVATTASSLSHSTTSVTTGYSGDYLISSHVYFSSSNWTPNSGQTEMVDKYSAASAGASGVSLAMGYLYQATTGATGAIQATAASNADTGIAHVFALRKNVPLTCITYDFSGATPLADWTLTKSASSALPSVVSGRLRLTNNSGNQAGAAHLTAKTFPAAGQKIVVEFDHFAYNGSGADGIAFTLSDATVSPVAGAYGGSLGYAQRDGYSGFAGGWMGIGIDEYGNYSNPTEGRTGTGTNSGFKVDAIAIRGSGSGSSGYKYLAGSGTLSPGIDSNLSSTAAPGYRYRLTVDHSNGVNAWTTVERDTGSGYQTVISRFDPKADSAQAAVPANWYLSYTGSTGASTNIHEIDNLSICAATIVSSGPVSFLVTVPTIASVCGVAAGSPSSPIVTITAKDGIAGAGNTVTTYTGSVTLSTSSGRGTFTKVSGSANGTLSGSTYTFATADNGTASFYLTNGYAENMTITATEVSPGTASGTSATMIFSDQVFAITPITTTQPENNTTTLVAGRPHQMKAELWKKDAITGSCSIDTGYTGSKNLDGWYTATASHPSGAAAPTLCPYVSGACSTSGCSSSLPASAPVSSTSSNNFTGVTFSSGTANFCVATTDVGQYSISLRDDTRTYSSTTDIGGTTPSTNLTVRPFALYAKGASGVPTDPVNTDYIAAGEVFNATLYAVRWTSALASSIDTNNDGNPDVVAVTTFTPSVTSTFTGTTTLSRGTVVSPSNGAGTLNGAGTSAITWSSGVGTPSAGTLYMDNVGSFTLKGAVSSYLGLSSIPYISDVFGRFYPYFFALKPTTGAVSAACNSGGFSYMGQSFNISYTVQAQSKQGALASNYYVGTSPDTYTGTLVTPALVAEDSSYAGTDLGSRLSGATASWVGGQYAVSSTAAIFSRPAAPGANSGAVANWGGPFGSIATATLSLGVRADAPVSGRYINGASMRADTTGVCTTGSSTTTDCNATELPSGSPTRMFYGRYNLANAFGSERLALSILAQTEYYTGTGWSLNTLDSCSSLLAAPTLTQNFSTGSVTAYCNGSVCSSGATVSSGNQNLVLKPSTLISPTFTTMSTGYVDVNLNVPSWLEYPWRSSSASDPAARATFGIYKSNNRLIFRRERY